MSFEEIEQLEAEVVVKLTALYTALGNERTKVGQAIEAMTGMPVPGGDDPALSAAAQTAIGRLGQMKDASDATQA